MNAFLPWFPVSSLADAKIFFEEKYAALYRQPWGYGYAVCLKSDGIPIGYVNVSMSDSHDLGYGLRRDCWGRGIMTEAGRAVVDRLRQDGLSYLTATHDVWNPRSGEVMKRLGMRYCYTYEERWQPKDRSVTFRMYQLNLDGRADRVYWKYWNESVVHRVEENL